MNRPTETLTQLIWKALMLTAFLVATGQHTLGKF